MLIRKIAFITAVLVVAATLGAADIYVCAARGSNGNPGTMTEPLKNIDKALGTAKAGDIIRVAGGNYFGLRGKGYLQAMHPVEIYGGYADDFKTRDILKYRTKIQPDNPSAAKSRKPLLTFMKSVKGQRIVVDGIIFDMGARNSYSDSEGKPEGCDTGMLLLPPRFNRQRNDKPTVVEQCLRFPATAAAGDVLIQNCTFLNGAKFGIQAAHKDGTFRVLNNVFVANRMAAMEIYGTGGKKGPRGPTEKGGHVEIARNTILFSWSRLKDMKDMGYGIRVMTKLSYHIHHNIIGLNVLTGVDHTRFNKNEWLKLDDNIFFMNKQAPLLYTERGQGMLERVALQDFADLEFASIKGNTGTIPKGFPFHNAYLDGFLNVRYQETADYNPDSAVNQLREMVGLNKQGKLNTRVSMFMNRYPLEHALKLFGACKKAGAGAPLY